MTKPKNSDRVRILQRLQNDLLNQGWSFKSELENYGDCFTPTERKDLKKIVEAMHSLAERISDVI